MEPIEVKLDQNRSYGLFYEPLARLPHLLRERKVGRGRCVLVTDANVASHYQSPVEDVLSGGGWEFETVVLPPGEASKSPSQLQAIYDAALAWGIDRDTPLLALGGGVVGDVAGYAAATLLRGIPVVQIPTTLIAQVDSAIGGKTGINHAEGKNLIGAFHQPAFVCTDFAVLQTLPDREWNSGLAEMVKHALIADLDLFVHLEHVFSRILARDDGVLREAVYRAARVKAGVVSEDETEQGRRAILNFGHTFAHSIERTAGYGTFTHGEAVALGMRAALHLSESRSPDLPRDRLDALVRQIPAPGHLHTYSTSDLVAAMRTDKKARGGDLRFVLLDRLGHAYVTADVERSQVEAAWDFAKGVSRAK